MSWTTSWTTTPGKAPRVTTNAGSISAGRGHNQQTPVNGGTAQMPLEKPWPTRPGGSNPPPSAQRPLPPQDGYHRPVRGSFQAAMRRLTQVTRPIALKSAGNVGSKR